ncbi:hypothetical protein HQN84_01135 [Pedobacter steynii]|jgi:hypothetical protein|nr:hypothetical protein [Pedobacter steynii]NQX37424.1 hypothetical protein [Pedobacter steynii]
MKKKLLMLCMTCAAMLLLSFVNKVHAQIQIKEYQITSTDNKVFNLVVRLTANQGIQSILVTDPGNTFFEWIEPLDFTMGGYEEGAFEGDGKFRIYDNGIQQYQILITLMIDGDGSGADGKGNITIYPL